MSAALVLIPPLKGEGRTTEGGLGRGQRLMAETMTPTRRPPITSGDADLPLTGGGTRKRMREGHG
jgi:hypothetical protein